MRAVVIVDVRDCGQIDWLRKNLSECGHGLRKVVVCVCCTPSRMNASLPPPPPPATASATIQQNADKLLALIELERNNVIASLTPQLVYIEQRLVQLQGKLADVGDLHVGDLRELANLQVLFTEFRNSSGVLAANAARIQELEALVNQLTADNHGLHTSVSKAVRDAQIASNKEEQATKTLAAFLRQLVPIGIGRRDDGSLGFSPDWKTVLEALQTTAPRDSSGRLDILKGLALLVKNEASAKREARPPQNNHPNRVEVIDLINEGPIAGPSQQS